MRESRSACQRCRRALFPPLAALLLGTALVATPDGNAVASPWWAVRPHHRARAAVSEDFAGAPAPPPYRSPLGRDHPLAGRLYDVRGGRFVTIGQMLGDLSQANLVLLGEQHTNVDHHALQAWLLEAIARSGRTLRVVFEMIDSDKQADVDRSLGEAPFDVDKLAAAIQWEKTGWPAFSIYRPVFLAAASWHLPIIAAGLSRERLAAADFIARESATGEDRALSTPLPDRLRDAMAEDIRASHCGYASEGMIDAMIPIQRRRDVTMARALLASGPGANEGGVLIAGFGHARADYGVPWVLRDLEPSRRVRTLGFLEVQEGANDPQVYSEALSARTLPFDYVWFTPRENDEDPCEKFRGQLETMESRSGKRAAGGDAKRAAK